MTPAAARREFRKGEIITLRRINPSPASPTDKSVRAVVRGYKPEELVGGINQAGREVRILAEDVFTSGFPLPIKSGSSDRVIITHEGTARQMMISEVDDSTGRNGSTLLFYIIRATG